MLLLGEEDELPVDDEHAFNQLMRDVRLIPLVAQSPGLVWAEFPHDRLLLFVAQVVRKDLVKRLVLLEDLVNRLAQNLCDLPLDVINNYQEFLVIVIGCLLH